MFKKQKGITLIALVVTIVVLLILAAVSINLVMGENGVLKRAGDATEATRVAEITDAIKMYNAANYIGKYTKNSSATNLKDYLKSQNLITESEFNNSDNTITIGSTTIDPKDLTTEQSQGDTSGGTVKDWTLTSDKDSSETPTVGDIVAHKDGEQFYIIKVDGTNITLLSMYNLKKDGNTVTLKQDTSGDNNIVEFSSSAYWTKIDEYPTLNDYPVPPETTSIVTTAKAYGENLRKEGRLLTEGEANSLKETIGDIIFGKYTTTGHLNYWLGSAYNTSWVWMVNGKSSQITATISSLRTSWCAPSYRNFKF